MLGTGSSIGAARETRLGRLDRKIVAEEPPADRRIDILDAAARAFMRQGFAATSLDRVSDEIGATKGAIYYYYRSKSELFFAVHRRGMELTAAAIRPPFEKNASDCMTWPARTPS